MANLKDIKIRITSVGSTMQITNAMKLVSAAKLKKAQDRITEMRPYANKLMELLANLSSNMDESAGGSFSQERPLKRVLLLVVSSNRGLCGAFNSSVIKGTHKLLSEELKGVEIDFITIGKKAYDAFKNGSYKVDNKSTLLEDSDYDGISILGDEVISSFKNETYDRVYLIYNQFKNAATQILQTEQILPIRLEGEAIEANASKQTSDYIFEPGKKEIVLDLIPKSIKTQIYKAILDSVAAEHGARMTAMHKATDNADDLRKELILTYNQVRQAAITKEILEIVAGAEALGG